MSCILLSTGNLVYRYSLRRIAEIAKECGIDGLEVVINRLVVGDFEKYGIKIFEDLDLPVLSLHAPYHILRSWGILRSELKRTISIASDCGIRRVVFHPPTSPFFQPDFYFFTENLRSFNDIADGKVELLAENLPKSFVTRFWHNPHRFLSWLKRKKLFLAFDCTHISSWGMTPLEGYKLFRPLIKTVHLNNTYECGIDAHLPPNEGCLNIEELLNALRDAVLPDDFHFVLEIDFKLKNHKEIGEIIKGSVDFVKLCLGKA
jgi:sugar phosphate isomerase/epimerase